jgi:hypothetical protein
MSVVRGRDAVRRARLEHFGVATVILSLVCVGGAISAVGCADAVTIHAVTNPAAPFAQYRTFSLGAPEAAPRGYRSSPFSEEVRGRVQPLIIEALNKRGYTAAPSKGDLVVRFGSGRRVVTVHQATPPEGEQSEVGFPAQDYDEVEASLVIDAFDATSGVRVWHGTSRVDVGPDRVNQPHIQRTIEEMFASFPRSPIVAR